MTSFGVVIALAIKGDKQPLCDYLLSLEEPLGKSERELLADYIAGQTRGRPSKSKVRPNTQRRAVIEYIEKRDAGPGREAEGLAKGICKHLGIGRSTFYVWVADMEETLAQLTDDQRALFIRDVKSAF